MTLSLIQYSFHWAAMTLALWVTGVLFDGVTIKSFRTLLISALLLGIANAFIRPVLVLLTLPLTLITLGLFFLVINALMLLLVSTLVKGFKVSGFWTAFFAGIFISVFSFVLETFIPGDGVTYAPIHTPAGISV